MLTKRLSSHNSLTEEQFQSQVIQIAQFHGYRLIYHTHDSRKSQAGWPDLVLAYVNRGRVLIRELKTATGKVSPAQSEWLAALQGAGINAGVWRPEDLTNGHIFRDLRGDA